MDYSKFTTETLEKLQKGVDLDPTKLNDAELEELSNHYKQNPPTPADTGEVGMLESFGRGAAQGASFGFSDELVGAVESALTDKTYQQARDESRRNNEAAETANPWTYMGGNIVGGAAVPLPGGSIASGVGGAVKGVDKLMRLAKIGAAAGGAASLGASNVDAVEAIKNQDTDRMKDMLADTAQGAAAGAVMAPFLGAAVPGAAKGAKDWWKSMRFGRDISDVAGYAMKNPKFMTSDNFTKVSDDLRNITQNELLPMVSDDVQKAATNAYDAAKGMAKEEVPVAGLLQDIKDAFNHTNPAVNNDAGFKDVQLRATSMLAKLADVGPNSTTGGRATLDAADVYRLREEIQNMISIADPEKISGNRDAYNSLLKAKDSIDKQLTAVGVPVEELSKQYKAVSELVGQTGVDLRNVDISKLPLREREAAEKLKRLLVTSKKLPNSDEATRLNTTQDILKNSGLADPAKVDDVFGRADDLSRQEYLLRSAMDESYLATDPKGYATGFGALTARGKALQATGMGAGVIGAVKQGGKDAVAAVGRAVYKATPDELISLASKMKDTKTAALIRNIASQPERKRKALLFAMMQNPAYREAVGAAEE